MRTNEEAWFLLLQVTSRLAELVQDDMDNDAAGIGVDTAAIIDHDGSKTAFDWENIPLAEVFETALAEAAEAEVAVARL